MNERVYDFLLSEGYPADLVGTFWLAIAVGYVARVPFMQRSELRLGTDVLMRVASIVGMKHRQWKTIERGCRTAVSARSAQRGVESPHLKSEMFRLARGFELSELSRSPILDENCEPLLYTQ